MVYSVKHYEFSEVLNNHDYECNYVTVVILTRHNMLI